MISFLKIYNEVISKSRKTEAYDFIKKFNKKIRSSGRLKDIISDTHNDILMINTSVAWDFMSSFMHNFLKQVPMHIDHNNTSKKSKNYFQLEGFMQNGNILHATFIYVDDKHNVIADRCNISLLDENYDDIEDFI